MVLFSLLVSEIISYASEHDAVCQRLAQHLIDDGAILLRQLGQRPGQLVRNRELGGDDVRKMEFVRLSVEGLDWQFAR